MAEALRPPGLRSRGIAKATGIRSGLRSHPRHFRGRHHAATIFVIVVLTLVAVRFFPPQTLTIVDEGRSMQLLAGFGNERAQVAEALQVGPGDRILKASDGTFAAVAVDRAIPVTIAADDTVVAVRTQATTVGGALAEAGIDLRPGDVIYLNGRKTTTRAPLAPSLARAFPPPAGVRALPGVASFEIRIQRAVPVSLYIDTLRVDTVSSARTVGELLEELGLTVREGDLVQPAQETPLAAGMSVHLDKARSVHLVLDGKEQTLYTQAETVADIVRILGIELDGDDTVSLPLETPVEDGMSLTIALTRVVEEAVQQPIPPSVVYETDPSLPPGAVKVIPGQEGVRLVRYRVTYRNGVEVARERLPGSTILKEPVPARHVSGPPASTPSAPLDAPEYSGPYKRKLTVVTTWYNASHGGKSPDDPWYGITATGVPLDKGVCAVDPAVIPLGTWMYIPGYGLCLAADVGGGVKGYHVDLGFPESVGDPGWGKRTVEIYILE